MKRPASVVRIVFLSVFLALAPGTGQAQTQMRCSPLEITVAAASRAEAGRTCRAVILADSKLRSLGLEHERPLLIEVTEELDFAAGYCLAYYDAGKERLQVLSEPCLEETPPMASAFPDMPASVLFESLIHHELTHAYLDEMLPGRTLPRAAHEYLAYAVQVDALPGNVQEQLLDEADVSRPVGLDELNESILFFAPKRFAASSWLYFRRNGGGAEAVERVLAGQDRFRPGR